MTQDAPQVDLANRPPDVTVQRQQPQVTVRQPQQTITMEMPAPRITIEQPAPAIVITMPDRNVDKGQTEPPVDVTMAGPALQVEQGDPEIAFDPRARILSLDMAEQIRNTVESGGRQSVRTRSEQQGAEPDVSTEVGAATVSQSGPGEPNVDIAGAEPVEAEVAATRAELQEANRRLEDMPRAGRSARRSAGAPGSCLPTGPTCPGKMPRRPKACSKPRRRGDRRLPGDGRRRARRLADGGLRSRRGGSHPAPERDA